MLFISGWSRFANGLMAVVAAVGVASVLGGCFGESHTLIGPNDTFMLGGEQRNAFVVRGENVGTTAVEVLARSGTSEQLIVVAKPGDAIEHRFAAGEIAMFRNPSGAERAMARIELTSQIRGMSMRYQGSQKAQTSK